HVHVGTRPSGDADRTDRAGRNGIGGGMPGGNAAGRDIPDRTHFAEAYALFRAKGAWPDEPEGFLHEVSARIGWPPQVVRVMRDVFEELGFLRVENGWVTMEPSPAKRDLAESVHYREARWRWAGERLAGLPREELAQWIRRARRGE